MWFRIWGGSFILLGTFSNQIWKGIVFNTIGKVLERLLKVRLSRNEFMKSSIFQNSNWNIWRISGLKGFIE